MHVVVLSKERMGLQYILPVVSVCLGPLRYNVEYSDEHDDLVFTVCLPENKRKRLTQLIRPCTVALAREMLSYVAECVCVSPLQTRSFLSRVSFNESMLTLMVAVQYLLPDCYELFMWMLGNVILSRTT